jgi:hypothetical protein
MDTSPCGLLLKWFFPSRPPVVGNRGYLFVPLIVTPLGRARTIRVTRQGQFSGCCTQGVKTDAPALNRSSCMLFSRAGWTSTDALKLTLE